MKLLSLIIGIIMLILFSLVQTFIVFNSKTESRIFSILTTIFFIMFIVLFIVLIILFILIII